MDNLPQALSAITELPNYEKGKALISLGYLSSEEHKEKIKKHRGKLKSLTKKKKASSSENPYPVNTVFGQ